MLTVFGLRPTRFFQPDRFPVLLGLIACAFAIGTAHAQTFSAKISELNFTGLPRVTMKICTDLDGQLIPGLDSSHFTLMENGVPQSLRIRCPDPGGINSVVLVLDNSGSMLPVMSKLIEAASRLVDSLDAADECAIITFGRNITVRQDFTSDKALLKSVLSSLISNGGTPMYDASLLGVQLVGRQSGNRNVVIITDGEDNMSTSTEADVIAQARFYAAKLYTIAFNIELLNQKILERMALQTGGSFFIVERPSELTAVYERIAAEITEKCCLAEYESTNCADTVRTLDLAARYQGRTATDRQVITSPARPARSLLTLSLPDELMPLADGTGFISMTPPPSTELELNLSFTLVYDPDLVDITPPILYTLGTVAQNQVVDIIKVAPGEMRFLFNRIKPASVTPLLVGFPVHALLADSSRRVRFTIRDIVLEGCPSAFSVAEDSTTICQCLAAMPVQIDSVVILGPSVADSDIPIRVAGGLNLSTGLIGRLRILLPGDLELLGVYGGSLLPEDAIEWTRLPDGTIEIGVPNSAVPTDTAGTIAILRVRSHPSRAARYSVIRVLKSAFWQQCCMTTGPSTVVVVQDGECERVLLRSSVATVTIAPNPLSGSSRVSTVSVFIPPSSETGRCLLQMMDSRGRSVATLNDGVLPSGRHSFAFDAAGLPSGRYFAVLQARGLFATGSLIYTP
jgi:VWFA-related protein